MRPGLCAALSVESQRGAEFFRGLRFTTMGKQRRMFGNYSPKLRPNFRMADYSPTDPVVLEF